jgi:hypothetical protein
MAQYRINNLPAPIDFEFEGDQLRRTLQNAKNLLMTRMGEVPYDRYRGFDPALYELPIGQMREALLPEADRVMMWEPDAEVVDAECELLPSGGILISLVLEIDIEE